MSQTQEQRQIQLAEYIRENGKVSMKVLPDIFKVSMNTIRADIDYLTKTDVIKKVYGGVEYSNPDFFNHKPIPGRINHNSDIKKQICKIASSFIDDGDIVYIDYGTTTPWIPDFIEGKKDVTFVTPNFYAILRLVERSESHLILLPGEFDNSVAGVISENTIHDISNYHFSKVFMACTGVDLSLNVTSTSYMQRKIKQNVISQADKCFLLVESTKFNCQGLLYYGHLSTFEAVITDSKLPEYIEALLKENKIKYYKTSS